MSSAVEKFFSDGLLASEELFRSSARYHGPMDEFIVLTEDGSYRQYEVASEGRNRFAVLLAPYEPRFVGVQVFGARRLIASCVHEALTPGELAWAFVRASWRVARAYALSLRYRLVWK